MSPDPGPASGAEYRPRSSQQWAVLFCGVLAVVALCLLAGRWQWHRYESREAEIARIESNYKATPVPLDHLATVNKTLDSDDVWRPATVRGHYDPAATVLLRNRPVGGQPGFHVLVPFRISTGSDPGDVMVIDRGFVPWGADASTPEEIPAPPAGDVTITVTLRTDEPAGRKDAPPGQVHTINSAQVLAAATDGGSADAATVRAYGQLRTESPAPATTPTALPAPDTDPRSHLSYAIQWCVFAAGALGGFFLLVRRDRRDRLGEAVTAGDLIAAQGHDARPRRAPRSTRPTAEDEEDALIDAQFPDDRAPQASETSST